MQKCIKDDQKEKIITLYNSGLLQKEIGSMFGVHQSIISSFMKRHNIETRNTQFPKGHVSFKGDKHPGWKGNDISYISAHQRVYRVRGKATQCSKCGKTEGIIDWANVSGKYYNSQDFIELCRKCHREFDERTLKKPMKCLSCEVIFYPENYRLKKYKNVFCSCSCAQKINKKINNIEELKKLYLLGNSQSQLAKYYKVSKGTITNTLRREKIRKKDFVLSGY
jgi:transposase